MIVGLDNTIVNVALPAIRRELHASLSGLQWTIDAYTLVLASLLILGGSTADRIGRRRVFQAGLVVFTASSLLCGLSTGLGWLIAFRMLQAVGGSMLNPVAMSIITNTFTDPRERARAIGVWSGVVGFSFALGPMVGGLLIDSVTWRAIFWINVPVGILALVLTALYVPQSRAARPRKLDPVAQVLVLAALASVTYAIIEGPNAGWTSPVIIGAAALGVVAVGSLLAWEPRREEPLIELRFFRSAAFSGATVIAVCAFAALSGFLFLNTVYLQEVRHLDALHAGLYTLPIAAMTVVLGPLTGRFVGARGPRLPLLVSGVAFMVSAWPMVRLTAHSPLWLNLVAGALFGLGFATVNAPITNTGVSGMPTSQAGVAAAIVSTSRQVGQSLGIAVIGSTVTSALRGGSLAVGFAAASRVGWWIISACGLAVLVVGLVSTSRWARRTAVDTAEKDLVGASG